MKFNKAKWIAAIIFGGLVISLILIAIFSIDFFKAYSDLIEILGTLSFIYLTYETLRQTRQSETSPYISVRFLLSSKIDEDFLKKHRGLVINEQINRLLEDSKREDPPRKDLVFIEIENVGETTAIEVKVDLQYSKEIYGKNISQNTKVPFGTLKKDETITQFLDLFDVPTKNDFFKIEKCMTFFNTAARKHVADGLKKNDVLESLSHKITDDNVIVTFKKP